MVFEFGFQRRSQLLYSLVIDKSVQRVSSIVVGIKGSGSGKGVKNNIEEIVPPKKVQYLEDSDGDDGEEEYQYFSGDEGEDVIPSSGNLDSVNDEIGVDIDIEDDLEVDKKKPGTNTNMTNSIL